MEEAIAVRWHRIWAWLRASGVSGIGVPAGRGQLRSSGRARAAAAKHDSLMPCFIDDAVAVESARHGRGFALCQGSDTSIQCVTPCGEWCPG